MTSTLLDISKKIEFHKAAVLSAVNRTAQNLDIPFYVVGAAARDFILQNGHNIPTPRATHDVDIGVCVSSWDKFTSLIERLLTDEHFSKTAIEHRFDSPTQPKTLVDILPFGPIESSTRNILWQQDNREMNMVGFTEAFVMAIDVKIIESPPIVIKMVSMAGLALLKLLSWNDKPLERDRDAKDFRVIMYHYLETQSEEYLYDSYPDIAGDGDYERISARSLGRDISKTAGVKVVLTIKAILIRECNIQGDLRFIQHMQQRMYDGEMTTSRDIDLLNSVLQGVSDV